MRREIKDRKCDLGINCGWNLGRWIERNGRLVVKREKYGF